MDYHKLYYLNLLHNKIYYYHCMFSAVNAGALM